MVAAAKRYGGKTMGNPRIIPFPKGERGNMSPKRASTLNLIFICICTC